MWGSAALSLRALPPRSNGVYLGYHDSGYTSFFFYIHNLTDPMTGLPALNYGPGADNVLAVRVDALTAQEGAWGVSTGGALVSG